MRLLWPWNFYLGITVLHSQDFIMLTIVSTWIKQPHVKHWRRMDISSTVWPGSPSKSRKEKGWEFLLNFMYGVCVRVSGSVCMLRCVSVCRCRGQRTACVKSVLSFHCQIHGLDLDRQFCMATFTKLRLTYPTNNSFWSVLPGEPLNPELRNSNHAPLEFLAKSKGIFF